MKNYIGEEGTEQFTVQSRLNGKLIREQLIHDPFITTTIGVSRWDILKSLLRIFQSHPIKVQIHVGGSPSVMRRIMTMDPHELQRENEEFLHQTSRTNNIGGHCLEYKG